MNVLEFIYDCFDLEFISGVPRGHLKVLNLAFQTCQLSTSYILNLIGKKDYWEIVCRILLLYTQHPYPYNPNANRNYKFNYKNGEASRFNLVY